MSQQSPTGFAFGILIEIAAVVGIVSLLPRFDLRPANSAAADQTPPPAPDSSVTPIGWNEPVRENVAARPTSYYQRQTPVTTAPIREAPAFQSPTREELVRMAPPLIEVDANRPQFVEQRLDRASQSLVNSLGTAVTQAADSWRRDVPQPTIPGPASRQPPGQQQTQVRPWIRY
jgi:hypothetical protein